MSFRVDLLRHGRASTAQSGGDSARTLAPEGAAAASALGLTLGRLGWRPDRAYASPLTRARQTAQLVLSAAGLPLEAVVMWELAPDREPEDVVATLHAEMGAERHVLLVGHQPMLGELAAYWLGDPLPFSPGEFLAIELEAMLTSRSGKLVERIAPD